MMKVSVLVPVYNLERFIGPCLESLLTQQMTFDFEVIAIDDGSSDDSWTIMQQLAFEWPQLRVLQNPQNMGVCLTIRYLLEQARGEYLIYVDGDDLALPGKIQTIANHLDNNLDCGFVYHEAEVFNSDTGLTTSLFSRDYYNYEYIPTRSTPEHLVLYGLYFNTSSCGFRRHPKMLEAVNTQCSVVNDYSWHILNNMFLGGRIDFIPHVYGRYRIHGNSICNSIRTNIEYRQLALHDMLSACDLARAHGMSDEIVNRGKSHLYFSTALFFLRVKNFELFDKYITESTKGLFFFDERHEFSWNNKANPEEVFERIFKTSAKE